jgi:hypothetical protein
MIERRQVITAALAVLALLVGLWYCADLLILSPAGECDDDIARLEIEIQKLEYYNRREPRYRKKFKELVARTLELDPLKAREHLRRRLGTMVEACGLKVMDDRPFSEISSKTVSGMYKEIGWKCSLVGSLRGVVNMLYLMQADPYLHRIDGLVVNPDKNRKQMRISFRYTTLVIEKRKGDTFEIPEDHKLEPVASLAKTPHREVYDSVAERNLFRPYVKKQKPRVVKKPPDRTPPSRPPRRTGPDYSRFKVVSLTRWQEEPEICISETRSKSVKKFKIGDSLAGGRIVFVDYRKLPLPDNPEILSQSRVILKIGADYFAVELGGTLDRKYLVKKDRMPPGLIEKPEENSPSKPAPSG